MKRARTAAAFGLLVGVLVVIIGIVLIGRSDDGIADAVWEDRSTALENSVLGVDVTEGTSAVELARDQAAQDKMVGVIVAVTGGLITLASVVTLIALPRRDEEPAEV